MRKLLKYLHNETYIGHLIIDPIKKFTCFYRPRILPEKIYINRTFKNILGYKLNLEDPKTFNEKIHWFQLNSRIPLHSICADKYTVREYVRSKIGESYLIPLVFHTTNPAEIIPDNLPDFPFIIKTNHASGGHIIVKDKSIIDWEKVQKDLRRSLKRNFYYHAREWQYKNITPCIIVEKLLLEKNGSIPLECKFHCCNGEVAFIGALMNTSTGMKRIYYDSNWNFIDYRMHKNISDIVQKPKMLNNMKSIANILAEDFHYVRVDLYNVGRKIFFGELTFSPSAGFEPFYPREWDRYFGDKLI